MLSIRLCVCLYACLCVSVCTHEYMFTSCTRVSRLCIHRLCELHWEREREREKKESIFYGSPTPPCNPSTCFHLSASSLRVDIVNSCSLHPTLPLLATGTGQRKFISALDPQRDSDTDSDAEWRDALRGSPPATTATSTMMTSSANFNKAYHWDPWDSAVFVWELDALQSIG
jgi:hypothetical protein